MKKIIYLLIPVVAALAGCSAMYTTASQPGPYNDPQGGYNDAQYDNSPQTDQVFYDELSPYGTWVDYPDYGYVWVPNNVDSDFRPYATNGYWVYSDYGWTWASNYDWGWATFHYGRWFYDDYYGWMWVPGEEWAPAWVTWGTTGDYYCWAPLAPRVSMREANLGWWKPAPQAWNIVPGRHFTQVNINYYIINNTTIVNNVRIINNSSSNYYPPANRGQVYGGVRSTGEYNRGPQLIDVERITNNRIPKITVTDRPRPGAPVVVNNRMPVYHPVINRNYQQDNNNVPAPRRFEKFRVGVQMPQQGNNQNNQDHNRYQSRDNGQDRPNPQVNPNQNPGQNQFPRRDNGQDRPNPQVNPNQNPGQNQFPRRDNGQNRQDQQPNQNQFPHRDNGQDRPNPQVNPNQNPGQNQFPRRDNGQDRPNPQVNPNQSPGQNQFPRRDNGQDRPNPQVNPNPNPGQNQFPRHDNGQDQQHANPNPDKRYAPAQPGQQNGNNPPVLRPENNPNLRPNLQPVRPKQGNNPPQNRKPDTTRRRPNNQ